jgi:hypothetical protein
MEDNKAVANIGPNPFEAYGNSTTNTRIVGQLLKFSKGDYLAGQEGTEIALGSKFVAIMDQLMVGWIKWRDATPVEHVMGLVSNGYVPPKRAELDDNDEDSWDTNDDGHPRDPWQFSNYLVVVEPKEKTPYTFTTSSKGGLGAIGELCKFYGKAMRERPDDFPVIELGVGSYMARDKSRGRIKFPILKPIGWTAKAPLLKALEGSAAAESEESESEVIKAEKEERAAKATRRGRSGGTKLEDTF